MYAEVIKIRPVLDEPAAKKAEKALSKRFANVSKKFGSGLKAVMKGNLLFLSLGFLTNLLNPLKEVEERIKTLMGQGTDIKETADQFGTTPGQLKRLQDVAGNIGLTPDKLQSMIESFSSAVDKARIEEKDRAKTKETQSESFKLVKNWLDETDMAEAFFSFAQSLNAIKGSDLRQKAEMNIFGGIQKGASQRFIDANFRNEFARLGTPSIGRTNKAVNNLNKRAEQDRRLTTDREGRSFVNNAENLNPEMIAKMNAAAQRELDKEDRQNKAFDDLQKAQEGIAVIMDLFIKVSEQVTIFMGEFGRLVKLLSNSRLFRGIFGNGK